MHSEGHMCIIQIYGFCFSWKKFVTMNFAVQTSLGILCVIILINADVEQSNIKFNQQCQVKKKKGIE